MSAIQTNYYLPTFERLTSCYGKLIENQLLHKPKEIRIAAIKKQIRNTRTPGPAESHRILSDVLTDIERHLQATISKHSCFYWIHLYRRIGVMLSDRLGGNTGPMTLAWVRSIAEQAIYKYGNLHYGMDIRIAKTIHPRQILGGEFIKSVERWPHIFHQVDKDFATRVASSSQWVLTDFKASDLAGAYHIEGLAYQYWYINAKQRAAGKGVLIEFQSDGNLSELRTDEQSLLITNYDERLDDNQSGLTTNVGTYVSRESKDRPDKMFCVIQNVNRVPIPESAGIESPYPGKSFIPNFLPMSLNIAQYYTDHCYLEKAFQKKNGVGLKEFCAVAYALSYMLIYQNTDQRIGADNPAASQINMIMRGYVSPGLHIEALSESIRNLLNSELIPSVLQGSSASEQIEDILNYLALNDSKQEIIGLWSLGPRFVIIPHQSFHFFDNSAWVQIFRNLFYGLQNYDPENLKGSEFESMFADLARSKGLDVILESREILLGTQPREIDVGIRVNKTFFVCECRASERPLNYEIGSPKTILNRCADLDKKVEQVLTLTDLFKQHPAGVGYDVSWAEEIIGIVVSPYTEWIWSHDERLFVSKEPLRPRIMAVSEAISFMCRAQETI